MSGSLEDVGHVFTIPLNYISSCHESFNLCDSCRLKKNIFIIFLMKKRSDFTILYKGLKSRVVISVTLVKNWIFFMFY